VNQFEACEIIRAMVLGCLDPAEPKITTTYTGAGQLAWDDCCGTLVVTPERIYQSVRFPDEYVDEPLCDPGYWVIDVLISLVRCVPTLTDDGKPPTSAALQAAHSAFMIESAAILCCVTGDLPDDEWEQASVNQQVIGAEGGCIMSETRMKLGTPAIAWCC